MIRALVGPARAVLLAAALALLPLGCATAPASTLPRPADTDLPAPTREVLPNGLRLIVQEHRAADIVAVHLWVGVGVRYEKPDELGYSHFQEHMLFKGTDKWGPGHIDRAVEGIGGKDNAVTSFDYTNYYIILPSEGLDTAVELLRDMAFRSTFDPKEIAREREVIFEEANIEQDNPKTAIVRQLYGLVFAGNPYGRPVLGIPETMNAATRARLLAYNREYYTPENMALVIVGPVNPEAVRPVVKRTFGAVASRGYKPAPAPAPTPLVGRVSRDVERPEQQAMLALGWQAPRSDDPTGNWVDLLTSILAGTDSSRLAKRLRDDENLVSGITMNYAALVGGGIVSLRAELEAKDLAQVERIILEEIARMQADGPTAEELKLAVTKFESEHAFSIETAEGLANAYGIAETTWTIEAELRYVDSLRQVTREQVRDAARRFLSRANYARIAFVPKKP
ncbi:MAG TPA: pitrilysin family protein [Methylomirabilota bacterium]|nr:pitrilysin family protein [Methylomirabilota bacterium]